MKRLPIILLLLSTVLTSYWVKPKKMSAQDTNRVAVVIRQNDQSTLTACVEFPESEISGLEALQRSGFAYEMTYQGLGALVCSIENTGCPADDCWCKCKGGGDCVYWSYWNHIGDRWQYAQTGSSQTVVRHGDVDGWSWGPGSVSAALPPPNLSFDQICESDYEDSPSPTATSTTVAFSPVMSPTSAVNIEVPNQSSTLVPTPSRQVVSTKVPAEEDATRAVIAPTTLPTSTAMGSNSARDTEQSESTLTSGNPEDGRETLTTPTSSPTMTSPADSSDRSRTKPSLGAAAASSASPTPVYVAHSPNESELLVERMSKATPALTIVGSAFEMPAADSGGSLSNNDNNVVDTGKLSTPVYSYVIFGLIVAALSSLLLISSLRRRTGSDYHTPGD